MIAGRGTLPPTVPAPDDLPARVDAAIELIEELARDLPRLAELPEATRVRLVAAAGQLSRPDRYSRKALGKALVRARVRAKRAADRELLDATGIRALRREPVFKTPLVKPTWTLEASEDGEEDAWAAAEAKREEEGASVRVADARLCYCCKTHFHDLHHFYDQMCPACAELNYRKRTQTADLRGRVVLVTGARVKIGYQAAIKLLRAGAEVIVATRFPRDASRRYAAEPDAAEWAGRLHIYGIDLRHTPSVELLARHLVTSYARLDGLINNACQTVRRPSGWYDHVLAREDEPAHALEASMLERNAALRGDRALAAGHAPALAEDRGPRTSAVLHGLLMRLAHCSDLHLLSHDGARWLALANKRWIGAANLLTSRSRHYHVAAFEQMIADIDASGVDHVLCTGDITNLALEQEFQFARGLFDRFAGGPERVTVIPGNHDAYVAEGLAHFATFFEAFSRSDAGWDWPEDARLGTEDDLRWPLVRLRGDLALIGVTTSRATPWFTAYGFVGEGQLARLRAALADPRLAGKRRLVAIHHPPAGKRARSKIRGLRDHEAFAHVIADVGADLIVHGHEHRDMREQLAGPAGAVVPVIGIASGTYEHGDPDRVARYQIYEISDHGITSDRVRVWDRERSRFDNALPREIPHASP